MPKLFANEVIKDKMISYEHFADYHKTANVISTEAISDFLSIARDKVNVLANMAFTSMDTMAIDATAKRFETTSALRRVEFSDIAYDLVTVPERFSGNLVDFARDLIKISEQTLPETKKLLDQLKLAVAGFINEYQEDGVMTVFGKRYSDDFEKGLKKSKGAMGAYFTTKKANTTAQVKEVLRRTGDVEVLLDAVRKLDGIVSLSVMNDISKLSREASDLVDILIEQNKKTGILVRNDAAKRDLVDMIHVAAAGVEFVAYLYANAGAFYTSLRSVSEVVIVAGNR